MGATQKALRVMEKRKKCQFCKIEAARPLHTCPFKIEINDDNKTLCDCCANCTQECALDI